MPREKGRTSRALRYEFKFVVDGIELPPRLREQLARNVAEVGMRTLAASDFSGDTVASFRIQPSYRLASTGNGDGSTQGMGVVYLPAEVGENLRGYLDRAERGAAPRGSE